MKHTLSTDVRQKCLSEEHGSRPKHARCPATRSVWVDRGRSPVPGGAKRHTTARRRRQSALGIRGAQARSHSGFRLFSRRIRPSSPAACRMHSSAVAFNTVVMVQHARLLQSVPEQSRCLTLAIFSTFSDAPLQLGSQRLHNVAISPRVAAQWSRLQISREMRIGALECSYHTR